jgi:CheY-like chemotaxis protein
MENKTILVIEDNAMNMKLIRTLLQLGQYRVVGAEDAETGIQTAREHRPDLILMDIQLPGIDGLSATRIIKEDAALMDIPVVALSSYAMRRDEENARKAGCMAYITKPIDTRVFLQTIDQHLR